MVLIPLGLIILWWLINNPAIALMILSLTAIIKGYLINYFPVNEIVDITVIATLIIWLGLVKILLEGNWKLPSEQKSIVYLFLIFGLLLGISYIYTVSPDYGFRKILRFNTFAVTMFISPLFTQSPLIMVSEKYFDLIRLQLQCLFHRFLLLNHPQILSDYYHISIFYWL